MIVHPGQEQPFRKRSLRIPILPLLVSLLSLSAYAQQTAASSSQAASSGSTEEVKTTVTVTAERRSEDIQHTGAAVTAVTGGELIDRGISDMKRLSLIAPSTRFSVETNVIQVFLRGIGTQIDSPFVPEPVATNFNDVYLPRFVTGTSLFDMNRIEVLPGPQSTLYGKSALGGVVNLNANLPTARWGVDLTFEGGNYSSTHPTIVFNAPLTNKLFVRFASNLVDHGAYFTNSTDTEHSRAERLSLLYGSGTWLVNLWGSYYLNNNRPQATVYFPFLDPNNPWHQPATDPISAPYYPPNGYDVHNLFGHYQAATFGGKIEKTFEGTTFTYIPSFVSYHSNDIHGVQGFPVPDTAAIGQTTHELRFANDPDARLSALGGLYYYRNHTNWRAILGPFLGGYVVPNTSQGEAAYTQLGYRVRERLTVTAGGRYSLDREDTNNAATVFPAGLTPPVEGLIPFEAHPRWNHFDWKAGAKFGLNAHSLLYGNVQSGYAPGGYQATQPVAGQKLPSQTLLGYTVGTKNSFLHDRVQLNDEAYYYDYKNYDITVQQGASSISFSVPKTKIYGDQIDLAVALRRHTRMTVSLGLLSARINQLVTNGTNYAGFQLPYAPSVTNSAGLAHTLRLPRKASLVFRVDSHAESHYWAIFSHTSGLRQGAFTKTDASVTYNASSGRWDVSVWGRNMENQATIAAASETGYPPPFAGAAFLEAPRTIGARLHLQLGHP